MVKKWYVTKRYHCSISTDRCHEAINDGASPYDEQGPDDCKGCFVYEAWKKTGKQQGGND